MALGKKAAVSVVALPVLASAAVVAWVRARWTRRVAAKGAWRMIKWRPTRKMLMAKPVRKGLFKTVMGAGKMGKAAAHHGAKAKLKGVCR
ncbi:MAG: hypothetical protein GF344_11610 [Chitinivibrionales bacterium]|nr:hypothetical protein [Chitinivibrionales bacterium]MBD3357436.1 hypothetical protein [Chitinivibrionales bacterium]